MEAYIIKAYRTAVGKANKGVFRNTRPDDLAVQLVQKMLKETPELPKNEIEDVIVGNAMPEAEQGLNMGRMISLMGLDSVKIPGMTVNRYCSSGLESIAIAAAKIKAGMADCILAGGVESMSAVPMGGWRLVPNSKIATEHPDWYWNMGTTAEALQMKYEISREKQDLFALSSHEKAIQAIEKGYFKSQIIPIDIEEKQWLEGKVTKLNYTVDTDEGARKDTTFEKLEKLKPVFAAKGTVTAGNSSQTSDGAAFVFIVSEDFVKRHQLAPIARFVDYAVVGVEPKHMGIGPVDAIPKVLKQAGMSLNDMSCIELNEAFSVQALAVMEDLDLNPEIINPNGGAIALGHPLGCTGAKLSTQLIHELIRTDQRYGMVSMCVGSGQGAAGIFERL